MHTSWCLVHILPPPCPEEPQKNEEEDKTPKGPDDEDTRNARQEVEEEEQRLLRIPQVGTTICHFVGSEDGFKSKDTENVLWEKIQDGARPAWAPDLLRLGYAVVFKREGLPKMAARLGIKNPVNVPLEKRRGKRRVLTFDDVMVMGVVPHMRPFYFPDKDLSPEDWWLSTREPHSLTSPYLAPKGCTIATGAKRMADVVIEMLRQPGSFPRSDPTRDGDEDYSEFLNPLTPLLPRSPAEVGPYPRYSGYGGRDGNYYGETGYGFAGIELYRYGSTY